ncbi:MAG: quinone oxidoreductase family protein [Ktedonobacterales bacterium]
MTAIRVHTHGGPEVLTLEEVPVPEPGQGEVRVKIAAIGVNFIDTYKRSGAYQIPLPAILGEEASGTVDALGPDVTEFHVGQHVAYASVQGAYAEYAVVPAAKLVPVPEHVDLRQAAAVMLQGMTAHYLSHSTFPLRAGHTALVHAVGGGVGQLLTQMAKRQGARVIGTVSNEEKAQLARAAGANDIIFYTRDDFETETKRLTNGAGVDVVYDSVGKDTFDKSLNCLKPRGYLVLYGQSSGAVAPINPQVLNAKGSLFLTRPTLAHYILTREELLWRADDLFNWIDAGQLKVTIDKTFPLADATEAHRYLEARMTKGKVLLIP